jgi:lipopolysaccharide/colanic/teichoic acid biosynthesis glycosyltransferase
MLKRAGVTAVVALATIRAMVRGGPSIAEDHAVVIVGSSALDHEARRSRSSFALGVKRWLDVGVACLALIVGAPIFAAVAAVIWATGGPVLFTQVRVGQGGRSFTLYKFRSMVVGAESLVVELAGRNEVRGPAFKIRDDPRVTRLGWWLRRTSLDELPQLWNVLRGDMSLVGPRPPLPAEVARYECSQRRRLSVVPGITGMWQVNGRDDLLDFDDRVRLDLEYIDSWSLWLDAKIVLRTVPAVLWGRGAS